MSLPLVSVIIPTFNRADMILRAVSSVLQQTYECFEVIIVDDGSNDSTDSIFGNFNDSRVSYIRHNINRGGSAARNTGIELSQGEYIAFLDSDDEWLPEKLEKQVKLLLRASLNTGAVYTGLAYVANDASKRGVRSPEAQGDIRERILYTNCVGPVSSGIIRRECFEKIGVFDESLPSCQDWDMWIRISKLYLFDYVKDPLVVYHLHQNKITMNAASKAIGHQMILSKYYSEICRNKVCHARHRFVIGHYLARAGRTHSAISNFTRAIYLAPSKSEHYLHLISCLMGSRVYIKLCHLKGNWNRWNI